MAEIGKPQRYHEVIPAQIPVPQEEPAPSYEDPVPEPIPEPIPEPVPEEVPVGATTAAQG